MPRGRKTTLTITLTLPERTALQRILGQYGRSAGLHRRVRCVLLFAQGLSLTATGREVGLSRLHTTKWLKRWQAQGLEGLYERPKRRGPGKKRTVAA